jgi:hypothetical protein
MPEVLIVNIFKLIRNVKVKVTILSLFTVFLCTLTSLNTYSATKCEQLLLFGHSEALPYPVISSNPTSAMRVSSFFELVSLSQEVLYHKELINWFRTSLESLNPELSALLESADGHKDLMAVLSEDRLLRSQISERIYEKLKEIFIVDNLFPSSEEIDRSANLMGVDYEKFSILRYELMSLRELPLMERFFKEVIAFNFPVLMAFINGTLQLEDYVSAMDAEANYLSLRAADALGPLNMNRNKSVIARILLYFYLPVLVATTGGSAAYFAMAGEATAAGSALGYFSAVMVSYLAPTWRQITGSLRYKFKQNALIFKGKMIRFRARLEQYKRERSMNRILLKDRKRIESEISEMLNLDMSRNFFVLGSNEFFRMFDEQLALPAPGTEEIGGNTGGSAEEYLKALLVESESLRAAGHDSFQFMFNFLFQSLEGQSQGISNRDTRQGRVASYEFGRDLVKRHGEEVSHLYLNTSQEMLKKLQERRTLLNSKLEAVKKDFAPLSIESQGLIGFIESELSRYSSIESRFLELVESGRQSMNLYDLR